MDPHKRIYLCLAHMSEEGYERKYVAEAFDTHWVAPLGPNVNAFEHALEEYVGQGRRVVALSSGTAALHLALHDLGIGPGDEVMVQSFTFCASANPVVYLGATPVFVDSEPNSWNMDMQLLEEAIRDRIRLTGRKPKAIVPVSLYGMPYDADTLLRISEEYCIPVVEDSAEALGSTWNGRQLGTFGRYGVLSFNGNKMITTSGGGALICQNDEAYHRILHLATQARESFPYYQHERIGYNYRMSNVCAGIGRGQMLVAEAHIAHHRLAQQRYEEAFRYVDGLTVHSAPDTRYGSNYWLCTIMVDPSNTSAGTSNNPSATDNPSTLPLINYLDEQGIETRPLWKPMHLQPIYRHAPAYVNGVSESLFRHGLCLPSGPMVTDKEQEYIIAKVKQYFAL